MPNGVPRSVRLELVQEGLAADEDVLTDGLLASAFRVALAQSPDDANRAMLLAVVGRDFES